MMMRFFMYFFEDWDLSGTSEGGIHDYLFSQLLSVYHAYDSGLISSELLDVINSVTFIPIF
jgi:hypothetical protein